jgi:hypothetical protein
VSVREKRNEEQGSGFERGEHANTKGKWRERRSQRRLKCNGTTRGRRIRHRTPNILWYTCSFSLTIFRPLLILAVQKLIRGQ